MASKLKWRKHKDGSETAGPFKITLFNAVGGNGVLTVRGCSGYVDFPVRNRSRALRIARACAAALKEKP